MTHLPVSVVICTHNPKPKYLQRVLNALRTQTSPTSDWELIVVDNASSEPVGPRFDIRWHPLGRHVVEAELGLTPARLRGIAEARGDTIVFIDDDNIADCEYITLVAQIAHDHPELGTWGPGRITPEFETPPDAKYTSHLRYLALRDQAEDHVSFDENDWPAIAVGAGLCIRRSVATRYVEDLRNDAVRRGLDRRGTSLYGCGDIDLALAPREHGLGWGTFAAMRLTHIIPAGRIQGKYLYSLARATVGSLVVLRARLGIAQEPRPRFSDIWPAVLRTWKRLGYVQARFYAAYLLGLADGYRTLDRIEAERQ